MHTLEPKKIEKKFHSFREETIRLKQELEYDGEYELQAKKILKYAPRYIESLTVLPLKDRKKANAFKKIKKIKFLEDTENRFSINQWRLVLQNKFKSIQSFFTETMKWRTFKPHRTFSRMTEVFLSEWDTFKYVPGLVKLKSLHLCIHPDPTNPNLLKKINLMSRTLSSLKAMGIHWYQFQEPEVSIPFSSFIENKNILRSLTHLTLDKMVEDGFSNTFALLPIYCKSLTSLSLSFGDVKANLNALKSLKDFENLRIVRIDSKDLFPFFDHFTFPPSLREIKIYLEDKLLSMSAQLLEDMLASNQSMINFSEKWSNLQNLTSLALQIGIHSPQTVSMILTFAQVILESIPSLVHFELKLYYSRNDFQDSIDLTNIFAALQRFHDKLQTIKLSLPHMDLLTPLSKKGVTFPKLTKFELSLKKISDLDTIQNIFDAFEKASSENIEIELSSYVVHSNQAFLDLLKVLRKPPRNSKMSFSVRIESLDFDTFNEMFKEFIEKFKKTPVIQNVSLSITIFDPSCERGVEALRFIKNEMFESVEFIQEFRNVENEEYFHPVNLDGSEYEDNEDNDEDEDGGEYEEINEEEYQDEENEELNGVEDDEEDFFA